MIEIRFLLHFQDGGHLLSWIFEILKLTQDRHLDCATCLLCLACQRTSSERCSLQNTAAHLLTSTWHHDITPGLHQLHWLSIQRRVEFKIVCLIHQSLASTAQCTLVPAFNSSPSMVDHISAPLQIIILAVLHTYQFWRQKFRCYGTVAVEWSTS